MGIEAEYDGLEVPGYMGKAAIFYGLQKSIKWLTYQQFIGYSRFAAALIKRIKAVTKGVITRIWPPPD